MPAVMVVGLAVIVIVGSGFAVTVTVADMDALPPGPVADAVYVVVAVGLTCWVPPAAFVNGYELPSDPASVTCVAFTAVTVIVED